MLTKNFFFFCITSAFLYQYIYRIFVNCMPRIRRHKHFRQLRCWSRGSEEGRHERNPDQEVPEARQNEKNGTCEYWSSETGYPQHVLYETLDGIFKS